MLRPLFYHQKKMENEAERTNVFDRLIAMAYLCGSTHK